MVTAERAHDVILLFAPIVLGVVLVVVGFMRGDGAVIGTGGGLLGVPGIAESIKSIASRHRTSQPTG